MPGWLKLHRKILESAVFQNADALKMFIWILCKANTQENETVIGTSAVKIKKGQMVFGRKKAAEVLGLTENKCYRIMNLLEELKIITTKRTTKFTVVSVMNWELYQARNIPSEQQIDNKSTTNRQQIDNKQTHYKNNKEYKEYKEIGDFPLGIDEQGRREDLKNKPWSGTSCRDF